MYLPDEIRRLCMESLDRWMQALNSHDADAMDREMHFPHVRLAGGKLVTFEYAGANPLGLFLALAQESGWSHSRGVRREPIQASDVKVHWLVEYDRFRGDGSL